MRRTKKGYAATAFFLAAALAVGCSSSAGAADENREQLKKDIEQLSKQVQPLNDLFAKTIELVAPSVVSITTTKTVRVQVNPNNPEDMFPFPFPFQTPEQPRRSAPRQREFKQTGLGSGFVIDAENGYVVTNAHVVQDVSADDIKLVFSDGHEVTAEKVARDPNTDVAVIKIKPDHLVAVDWGTQADVKVGEWVIAVGSPMGFGNTVTAGIVSAGSTRSRLIGSERPTDFRTGRPFGIEDYIQTDAAINPGNSGGPLVTLNGKVIGINSLIVSRSGAWAGLGFAVPTRIAAPVVADLISKGKVVRGYLGVEIVNVADLNDDIAWEQFEMRTADELLKSLRVKKSDKGALVARVQDGSPAAKAGVEAGDLILSVDKKETADVETLRQVIAAVKPGAEVELGVMRKGRDQTVKVALGEQPGQVAELAEKVANIGLTAQTLTPEIARTLGYAEDLKGVVVTDVTPDSPAAKAGLQRDDVILKVGPKPVKDADEFRAAMRGTQKEGVLFLIKRPGGTSYMLVKP